jgi:hypothetical protein
MHSWSYVFVLHYAIVSLWYWHEVECNELIYSYLSLYTDMPGHLFSSTALGCISLFLHCCTECQLWAILSKYIQCYVSLSFFPNSWAWLTWIICTQHNTWTWWNHSGRWQSDAITHALSFHVTVTWKQRHSEFILSRIFA